MEEIIGLVAVVGTFSSIIVIAYLYFSSRHKIRMALIQHGQQANIFSEKSQTSSALKYGMLAVGIGIGIITGSLIEQAFNTESPVPHFSMMLIFGGAGLIAYHLIERKREEKGLVE